MRVAALQMNSGTMPGPNLDSLERLAEQATEDGWPAIALVAVNDAVGFWSRHGFVEQPAEAMAAKLASYGADARYMLRPL